VIRAGAKKIDQQKRDDLKLVLGKLNSFLEKSEWFAGDELTIADLAFLSNVGTIKV
jgi:glutathione S-transferase